MKKTMLKKMLVISMAAVASYSVASTANYKIDKLTVNPQFYPVGFEQELQTNLNFFLDGVGVDQLAKVPYDTIFVRDGKVDPQYYVNTSEIGLYLNILVEAHKNGNANALIRIQDTLAVLDKAPTWKGLFYWPYDIRNNKLQPNKDQIIPAVDNANLAFSLAGVAGAYIGSQAKAEKNVVALVEKILQKQIPGWQELYDPKRGLLFAAWTTTNNQPLAYHIDRKANESRLAPLWASLITADTAKPIPNSVFTDMELYTKSYYVNGKKLNPMLTWDGSYFQGMLPAIWLNERELMPDYGIIEDMTTIQKQFSIKNNIPYVSASASVDDGYAAYGVPDISESKVMFNNEIPGGSTGTPHAVALSYIVNPYEAVSMLKKIKAHYPNIETPFGWRDAVDAQGNMSNKILSLDQGMFVGAFLAPSINRYVDKYLIHKGYKTAVTSMYKSFVPNNK